MRSLVCLYETVLGSKEEEAIIRKEEMGEKGMKVRPCIEKQI